MKNEPTLQPLKGSVGKNLSFPTFKVSPFQKSGFVFVLDCEKFTSFLSKLLTVSCNRRILWYESGIILSPCTETNSK